MQYCEVFGIIGTVFANRRFRFARFHRRILKTVALDWVLLFTIDRFVSDHDFDNDCS